MGALIVIKGDKPPDGASGLFYRLVERLPIYFLGFDDAVDAFGNSIVRRLVILCHTDVYMISIKLIYIVVAAVLYPSVRVVCEFG